MKNQSDQQPPSSHLFDPDRAYRVSDICRDPWRPNSGNKLPMAKSAIYKAVKEGKFPPQVRLNSRTAVWFGRDLNEWLEEKYNRSNNAA